MLNILSMSTEIIGGVPNLALYGGGGAVVLIVIIICIFCYCKCRKNNNNDDDIHNDKKS